MLEGRGESIPLPDAAADAVFVSSAWHWMDHERAIPEIGRVLGDGGRLGLIWTSRDREVDWVRNLDRLRSEDTSEGSPADRFRRRLHFELPEPQIFHNIARETFRFVRTMAADDVVAMVGTYSRVIVAAATIQQIQMAFWVSSMETPALHKKLLSKTLKPLGMLSKSQAQLA